MRESNEATDHPTDEMVRDDPRFQDLLDRLRKQSPDQIQRLQDFLDNLPSLAPYPPRRGHKFVAERDRISVTIDRNLLKLLEDKRKSLGLSMKGKGVRSALGSFRRTMTSSNTRNVSQEQT